MRKAVTFLQSSHQLSGGAPISVQTVTDISGQVPVNVMDTIWKALRGRSFDALRVAVNDAVAEGYPMSAMLSQLHDDVVFKQNLSDLEKAVICEKIAQVRMDLLSEPFSFSPVFNFIPTYPVNNRPIRTFPMVPAKVSSWLM